MRLLSGLMSIVLIYFLILQNFGLSSSAVQLRVAYKKVGLTQSTITEKLSIIEIAFNQFIENNGPHGGLTRDNVMSCVSKGIVRPPTQDEWSCLRLKVDNFFTQRDVIFATEKDAWLVIFSLLVYQLTRDCRFNAGPLDEPICPCRELLVERNIFRGNLFSFLVPIHEEDER